MTKDDRQSSHLLGADQKPLGKSRLRLSKAYGVWLLIFSLAANALTLSVPLYLAQIYDRVLPSNSFDTLVYLTILVLFLLAIWGALESVRNKIAQRLSAHYAVWTGPHILNQAVSSADPDVPHIASLMQDVATVRQALSSRAFVGLFDLPFTPLLLVILFVVHPAIGSLTLAGMLLLLLLTNLNGALARRKQIRSNLQANQARQDVGELLQHLEDARALGMADKLYARWLEAEMLSLGGAEKVAGINGGFYGLVRFARQAIQIGILGLGAYLVLQQSMSAGIIFATSIVSGRAMLPIEQIIGSWRQLASARQAHKRIQAERSKWRKSRHQQGTKTALPEMEGHLSVKLLAYIPKDLPRDKALLDEIAFDVKPGELLAVIGPSGAGKSTLLRILASAIPPSEGSVRIDGFDIAQWERETLGRNLGYSSQLASMVSGSVADNIARFDPHASDEAIIEAAKMAGAHAFIGSLSQGYDTKIGRGGLQISGGQVQRIALARAFFGDPTLLLLDEPDAHLDIDAQNALRSSLAMAKQRKRTIVMVTQRSELLPLADRIMTLEKGRMVSVTKPRRRSVATPPNREAMPR